MERKFQKITFLCINILILFISTLAFGTNNYDDMSDNMSFNDLAVLDVKEKYNPLRTNFENNTNLYKKKLRDFNDENVEIKRVTYYDEFGNKTKEYKNEDALRHLYETEKQQPSLNTAEEISKIVDDIKNLSNHSRFETRVIESFVSSDGETKIIRKNPLDIINFNPSKFLFNAGLAYTKPVYSILTSAISELLPYSSTRYKAGDVEQSETYRHFEKYGQLKDTDRNGPWFSPIIIKRRLVNLKSYYYMVDKDNGDLTDFYTNFGNVEENINPLYARSDTQIISLALSKWNKYPYNHIYNWDSRLWPKDGKTITYSPTIRTIITR